MFKKVLIVVVGMALALSMVGVGISAGPDMNPKVKEMLTTAKASIKKVPAQAVKAAIDSKEKAIFLDVRDGGEFSAGHLPGAMNISRGTLEFNVFGKIPDQNAKIYVYCKTAARSALATKTLNDLGFKNAVLMDASYEAWVKAGYPVER
ncbi:MAG: rhodanese-like domain-containing protein [Thermodesulfobacteriota bacterium]